MAISMLELLRSRYRLLVIGLVSVMVAVPLAVRLWIWYIDYTQMVSMCIQRYLCAGTWEHCSASRSIVVP